MSSPRLAVDVKALGQETVRAAGWALVSLAAGRALSLVALVVLARLLAPADFGLLAFALVFVAYAETISDLGTSAALIYWPDRDGARDDVAQLTFVISLVAGLSWLALTLLAAPAVAAFFHESDTTSILRVLALTFPLKALGTTHDALAQKDLRFGARVVPELGLACFKGAVAILLATLGFGVWSLVYGHLAGVLAWTILLWMVVPWRPRRRVPLSLVRPVLSYGRDIVSVNVLSAIVHHADAIVVGRMLGATALGFYQVAGRVPDVTLMMIVRVAGRILFPAFARLGTDVAALRSAYLAALKYVALLVVPAAVALAALADPLVRVLFGAGWEPAVPILRALAVYAGLRAIGTHAGDVLKATGRPGTLATLGVMKAIVMVPALVVAARVDAATVAATLAGVTFLAAVLNLSVAARLLAVPYRDMAAAVAPAMGCAALVGLALAGWTRAGAVLPGPVALAAGVVLATATHLACVRLLSPEALDALWIGAGFARSGGRRGERETAVAGSTR
jgi:PST family polysaccharide transporter